MQIAELSTLWEKRSGALTLLGRGEQEVGSCLVSGRRLNKDSYLPMYTLQIWVGGQKVLTVENGTHPIIKAFSQSQQSLLPDIA